MTQNDAVIKHIEDHGSISQMEAYSELGVCRLSERIREIERAGRAVVRKRVTDKNRYGKTVTYTRYSFGS